MQLALRGLYWLVPRHAWLLLLQPLSGFAAGLLVLIWLAVGYQIRAERATLERDSAQATSNLAVVFEQNVARSISEIDRVMLFIREARQLDRSDNGWVKLINGRFTVNEQILQIAIADAQGLIVASNLGATANAAVNISDRPHFRVHATANADTLYISKPVVGRVSGKWSVQLTRRLAAEDGSFDGVIVISLDPAHLTRAYKGINLGNGGGLALIGTDDIVRAGTGIYAPELGKGLREQLVNGLGLASKEQSTVVRDMHNGAARVVALRQVEGYPLFVMVGGRDLARDEALMANRANYLLGGGALTSIILLAMINALRHRRRYEAHITKLAHHDSLTGLANRLRFQNGLNRAVAALAEEQPFALYLVDLDRFKHVNDTYGHPVGDKLLQSVAGRLRSNLRQGDLVARLGGDEFAIVQTLQRKGQCGPDHAAVVASRICAIVARPFSIDGHSILIGASIGVALAPNDGTSAGQLLKAADLALYRAKAEGRARYCFFHDDMQAAAIARSSLESDLRVAIKEQQFELHYQAVTDLASRRVCGFEALIRWRHPERGLVAPDSFIPLAEETSMIVAIGAWVLHQACHDMVQQPQHLKVAVNVSPVQFRDRSLVETVKSALGMSGLDATRLEIEITETTLLQNDDVTAEQLQQLTALGINILMDDFGTGYSSLSYLHTYPITCIKIDRSFVSKLGLDKGTTQIVRTITALAKGLGMSTIAEGVETEEQLQILTELGCDQVQGYYLARPMSAKDSLPVPPQPASRLVDAA